MTRPHPKQQSRRKDKQRRGRRSAAGYFASVTMGWSIPFRLLLQRNYLYIADQRADVTFIGIPQEGLEYVMRGETRLFRASYQLVEAGRDVVVVVDYERALRSTLKQQLVDKARPFYERQGSTFRTVTDATIYAGYRLRNARTLAQYALHNVSPQAKAQVCACLQAAGGSLSLAALIAALAAEHPAAVTVVAMHMLFHHALACPLDDSPLSRCSILSLPE